ncbi:hypothetical protein ERO13_D06G019700v2 [Gossypium hirsutum]|nr:hypothetical protein ERO13_D06G019700v2 [Gossypium hirsutum]
MAGQENCVRLTRSTVAKKRTAELAGITDEIVTNKKRVVLGELSNNVAGSVSKVQGKKPTTTTTTATTTAQKLQCKGKVKTRSKVVRRVLLEGGDEKKEDFDAMSNDPQMCGYYASDIYGYLHQMEVDPKRRPLPDYIEKVRKDVSMSMRGVLVDWLVEVAEEYKLVSDTLYMTVSYIDRFLSLNPLNRQRLQLLGVSSMLIASKYEEITPPNVEDFCYITDNTYTKDEVVKMEADILKSLKFELGNPTVKTFLRRFTRVAQEYYKFKYVATIPASPEIPASYFKDVQEVEIIDVEDVQVVEV